MSSALYKDLFEQAQTLAAIDARRPRQANLRCAISAAYYAVFHFLADESCRSQLGSQHHQVAYRDALARAFSHATMRSACNAFRSGNLKPTITKGLPKIAGNYAVPPAVRNLANLFAELQEKRHFADYAPGERFRRSDVEIMIELAKENVAEFVALPASNDRTFFLCCLWAYKELGNR